MCCYALLLRLSPRICFTAKKILKIAEHSFWQYQQLEKTEVEYEVKPNCNLEDPPKITACKI